jgi:hypothetical protein
MVHNVRYLCFFAELGHAFDVVGPPWREAAGCADDGKHVFRPNLRDCGGETVKVGHDIVPFHPVANNMGGATRRVNTLQARFLVDTEPQNSLAARAIGRQSKQDEGYGHSSRAREYEQLQRVESRVRTHECRSEQNNEPLLEWREVPGESVTKSVRR